jgi:hypothetical protein
VQVAGLQHDLLRQPGHCLAQHFGLHGNPHLFSDMPLAKFVDSLAQPFFAAAFELEFLPFSQAAEILNQHPPVHQESPAGLVAAKAVQPLNRPAATQPEEALDRGTIHHGNIKRLQHPDDLRQVQ